MLILFRVILIAVTTQQQQYLKVPMVQQIKVYY